MFKYLTINLTEPICDCEQDSLSWGCNKDLELYFYCDFCETKVVIPYSKLKAKFRFDKPHQKKKKPSLEIIKKDNVIQFPIRSK